ncbi:MAG: PGF-pre-PGF domain-containing protein [Candidatus Woesearchaeota archaeon]
MLFHNKYFKERSKILILLILNFIFILSFKNVISLNASLNYPLNNTQIEPYTNILLNITFYISEELDSYATGSVRFINYSSNTTLCYNESIYNNTAVSCQVFLNPGDNLKWIVNLTDETGFVSVGIWNFSLLEDNKPQITKLEVIPNNINKTTNITFNISVKDDYNKTLILEYYIYNQTKFNQNDLIFSGNISIQNNSFALIKNLTINYLKKGEIFNLTIRAFDIDYSNFNSTVVEVKDSLPIFYSELNSSEKFTKNRFRNDSILYGNCYYDDIDNDNYVFTAKLYKNAEVYDYYTPYFISVGFLFFCTSEYCFGYNDYGQLGDNKTITNEGEPAKINISSKFKRISSGYMFSCGILENNFLYCWGNNDYGQLGIGNYENKTIPYPIKSNINFTKISVGYEHACAISENNSLYCWGSNIYGQLGIGYADLNITNRTLPTLVNSSFLFKDVSAGFSHTCGILVNGSAYCWGLGIYGNLGTGDFKNYSSPVAVNFSNKFIDISAGFSHTCGLLNNGSLYCWGNNDHGQLGIGSLDNSSNPFAIENYLFKKISLGYDYSCGLLINNSAYCWGKNNYGQLGNGSLKNSTLPVAVNISELLDIDADILATCGILLNKTPVCWGTFTSGILAAYILSLESDIEQALELISPFKIPFISNYNTTNILMNPDLKFEDTIKLECSFYNETSYFSSINSTLQTISLPNLEIFLNSPQNKSTINKSFQIPLAFTLNETSKCKYSINNQNYINLNNFQYSTSFLTNFSIYSNNNHSIKINCTEYYGISKLFIINFTINDTEKPLITIIKKQATNDTINITFSTNEPSNWTFKLIDKQTIYYPYYANISSAKFIDLDQDTTYYFNITACDQLGNCNTIRDSIKTLQNYNYEESSSSTSSSNSEPENNIYKFTKVWIKPTKGEYVLNIPNSQIPILQIIFNLDNNMTTNLQISVEKINQLPSTIVNLTNFYDYIKIDYTQANLSSIKIKFRVENTWINLNNIDSTKIKLYRYKNEWQQLQTSKLGSDNSYTYYEAITPGFSYFSIAGEKNLQEQTQTQQQNPINTNQETQNSQTSSNNNQNINTQNNQNIEDKRESPKQINTQNNSKTNEKNFNILPYLIGIFIFSIISIILILTISQKTVSINKDQDLTELKNYILKCREEGIDSISIKNALLKVGWPENIVNLALSEIKIPVTELDKIKKYIIEMRKTTDDNKIKEKLKSVGWPDETIDIAFKNL